MAISLPAITPRSYKVDIAPALKRKNACAFYQRTADGQLRVTIVAWKVGVATVPLLRVIANELNVPLSTFTRILREHLPGI